MIRSTRFGAALGPIAGPQGAKPQVAAAPAADPAGSKLVAELAGSSDVTLKVYDGLYHEIFNEPEQEEVLNDLIEWLRPRVTGA